MYIHDYWNNPKKYDVYGDDFIFDLPGTVWESDSGKWLSGPTSQTYLEQTGVPFTREEIGSQRYIDFINSFPVTIRSGPSTSILNSGCRSSCVEYEVGTQNLYLHLLLSISSCVRKLLIKSIYL